MPTPVYGYSSPFYQSNTLAAYETATAKQVSFLKSVFTTGSQNTNISF